jgi:hypothetical protein
MGSFLVWWAAVSIIDVAPHVRDAFDPKVMLLGGKIGAESNGRDKQNIPGDLGHRRALYSTKESMSTAALSARFRIR